MPPVAPPMAGPKNTSSIQMKVITSDPFISDRTTDPTAAPMPR